MGLFVILKILYPKNSWNSVWENIFSEGDPCKNVFQKPMDFFFWKNVLRSNLPATLSSWTVNP